MTAQPGTDVRIIDIGTPEWCWDHLRDGAEGILSYRTARGAIALAVPYTVTDQQISIPVAPFNDIGWLAAGGQATLEVSGGQGAGLRWIVRVSGVARRTGLSSRTSPDFSRRCHPTNGLTWSDTRSSDRLMLPPTRVRGFYESLLEPTTEQPISKS